MKIVKLLNNKYLKLFIFTLITTFPSIYKGQNMSIYGNVIDTINDASKKKNNGIKFFNNSTK